MIGCTYDFNIASVYIVQKCLVLYVCLLPRQIHTYICKNISDASVSPSHLEYSLVHFPASRATACQRMLELNFHRVTPTLLSVLLLTRVLVHSVSLHNSVCQSLEYISANISYIVQSQVAFCIGGVSHVTLCL